MNCAKAVGRNEMPFGRETPVVQSNTVLDSGPGLHGRGDLGGLNPEFAAMPAAYRQITLALIII